MISRLNIRQMTEEREESLAPRAAKSRSSRGRVRKEEPCPIRTAFQRDRDRIIHAKAFRRLKHKTQVFIAPPGDHYVTRLTHTLEVSQIARTVARALNLNEDLTEAIALGHDLGHTPFGHAGEDVLDDLYPGGFRHNEQSLRVVDLLEKDGQGLNLTWETRDGILNHSKTRLTSLEQDWGAIGTVEGEVCRLADVIAYVNHDIGDAIRAGIITEADLPAHAAALLGRSHSQRINTMVTDIIQQSWGLREDTATTGPAVAMSAPVLAATDALRQFLFERVYDSDVLRREVKKAGEVVARLYAYLKDHEDRLPPEYALSGAGIERRVVDYIAGMTDRYALSLAKELSLVPGNGG